MKKIFIFIIFLICLSTPVFAYRDYFYDNYRTTNPNHVTYNVVNGDQYNYYQINYYYYDRNNRYQRSYYYESPRYERYTNTREYYIEEDGVKVHYENGRRFYY